MGEAVKKFKFIHRKVIKTVSDDTIPRFMDVV